jgi:hypothetical protein
MYVCMYVCIMCDIPVVLGNNYYENGRVRAQLFWLKILLLEGRHVSAQLLGHHQVTKNILKGNYVGGRVTLTYLLTYSMEQSPS